METQNYLSYIKYQKKMMNIYGGVNRKYIGEGAYGCIVIPALSCIQKKPVKPDVSKLSKEAAKKANEIYRIQIAKYNLSIRNLVSKIMKDENADKEWQETRILLTLDPRFEFYIYPVERCNVNYDSLFKTKENKTPDNLVSPINKCKNVIGRYLKNLKILNIPYGGKSINHLKIRLDKFTDFFGGFTNLLNGVKLLHDNDIVHLDIKCGNVLSKSDTFKFKLIDFGLSLKISDFYLRLSDNKYYPSLFSNSYYIWPPEMNVLCLESVKFKTKQEYSILLAQLFTKTVKLKEGGIEVKGYQSHIDNMITNLLNKGVSKKLFFMDSEVINAKTGVNSSYTGYMINKEGYNQVLKIGVNEMLHPDVIKWKNLPFYESNRLNLDKNKSAHNIIGNILKSVDVFQLGLVLAIIYAKYVGQIDLYESREGKLYKIIDKNYNNIPLPESLIDFLDILYNNLTKPLNELLKNVVNFDFKLRYNINQFIEAYTVLLPNFVILKDKNFEKLLTIRGFTMTEIPNIVSNIEKSMPDIEIPLPDY